MRPGSVRPEPDSRRLSRSPLRCRGRALSCPCAHRLPLPTWLLRWVGCNSKGYSSMPMPSLRKRLEESETTSHRAELLSSTGESSGHPPPRPDPPACISRDNKPQTIAALFSGTVVETRLVDDRPGSASAVKVCFAAWTKGTTALLLAIRALAETEGVTSDLLNEWSTSIPELVERSERIGRSGLKAWRFAPEMEEIAEAFGAVELPTGFHEAAAEVYRRLADLKDADPPPTLPDALERLTRPEPDPIRPSRG